MSTFSINLTIDSAFNAMATFCSHDISIALLCVGGIAATAFGY